jgi:3-methyladenine DNA glycosylase Mpg
MTVEEAAKYLFVSRAHIHALLAAGKLVEVLPRGPAGQPDIDIVSVEAYRTKMKAAQHAYSGSQTEDNKPLGL